MSQHYSDPTRADETYSLPDVETFYRTKTANKADGWIDEDGDPYDAGWYFWFCLPGCLPDSDPSGPYPSEQAAIDACRDMYDE